MADEFDPFRAPAPLPFPSQPRTGTAGDLLNPLYARTMATPAPYQPVSRIPGMAGSGQQYWSPTVPKAPEGPNLDIYDDVNKTSAVLVPSTGGSRQPGTTLVPPGEQVIEPPPEAPPMGGWEALGRGLGEFLFRPLPEDIKGHLLNGVGFMANLLDIPTEIIGNLGAVPVPTELLPGFSTDPRYAYGKAPASEAKALYDAKIRQDPANAIWYMTEYLRQNEMEVAKALGISPLVSDYAVPVNNLGDQLVKMLMLLGMPARMVSELGARSPERNIEGSILNAPTEGMNPVLLEVRRRYEAGEITREELPTILAREGFGLSNNAEWNLISEMLTDPLNVLLGAGVAAKAANSGARAAQIGRTMNLARSRLPKGVLDQMDGSALNAAIQRFSKPGQVMSPDDARSMARDADRFDWLVNNTPEGPQLADEAFQSLTGNQKALVRLDPVLQATAKAVDAINAPFGLPGRVVRSMTGGFRNGERIAAFSSRASVEGVVSAYGPQRVLDLFQLERRLVGSDENLSRALGRAAANMEVTNYADALARMASNSKVGGGIPPHMEDIDKYVRGMSEVYHSRLAIQVEGLVRRVKSQYLPSTRLGGEGLQQTITRQRRIAAQQLKGIMPNADEADLIKWADRADEETLALIEHLYWGHLIGTFTDARTLSRKALEEAAAKERAAVATRKGKVTRPKQEARAARAEALRDLAGRYTPIGPKHLTLDRAKKVLNSAKRQDIRAVRDAVDRYDDLYSNFASRGLTDEELLRDMQIYLNDLLKDGAKGGRLVVKVSRDKLPVPLRNWVDEQTEFARRAGAEDHYEIGISPEPGQRWRTVHDDDGRLVGVNPWVDVVPDQAEVRGINNLTAIRQRLFRPIRGERILEEARRSFRQRAVVEYGLARSEANALFSAIRRRSGEAGAMPRGLSGSELNDLLNQMNFPEAVRQRLGTRGMAKLVAAAFEGEIGVVGLTQKISGRAKRVGASRLPGNNWLGVVAERLYPLARFTYNPIFLAQEALEPFFWLILRGHKPGMRWRPKDIEWLTNLRSAGFLGEWADQWEFSPAALMLHGRQEADRVAGSRSLISKTWGKFIGEGRRVTSLAELKRLNYVRQVASSGLALKRMADDLSPSYWDLLVREAGTGNPNEVANWFWHNKGFNHPDHPRTQTFLYDATKPGDVGARSAVHDGDLARFHNFVDAKALRKAVSDGTYTETQFRAAMDDLRADPDYVQRAWKVATHMGPEAWERRLADAFLNVYGHSTEGLRKSRAVAKNTRVILREFAKTLGYTEEQFLAMHGTRPARFLDSAGALPKSAKYQLMTEESTFEWYGSKLLPQTDQVITRIGREAEALAGPLDPAQQSILDDTLAAELGLGAPEGNLLEVYGAGIDGSVTGDGRAVLHVAGKGRTYDHFWQTAFNALGGRRLQDVVTAHRNLASAFHMLTDKMSDDVVWRLTDEHIAQPYDIHKHRMRVEQRESQNILLLTGDLSQAGDDIYTKGQRLENRYGEGADFFQTNFGVLKRATGEDAATLMRGTPNTGVRWPYGSTGEDHIFGWYDENGELSALASVQMDDVAAREAMDVAGTPGTTPRGVDLDFPWPNYGAGATTPVYMVQRGHVAYVGVDPAKKGRGLYNKLADYVTSEGTVNWADITGRGVYTQQGSPAALAWLVRKDHETLAQAREALASRMMAGLSHIIVQNDLDPAAAIQHMMSLMEGLSGKHQGGVPYAYGAIEELLDFSRNPLAPGAVIREGADDPDQFDVVFPPRSEAFANWRQHMALSALLPPTARGHADAIIPTTEAASAFGYATQDSWYDMGGSGRIAHTNVPEGTGLSDFMGVEPRDDYMNVSRPPSSGDIYERYGLTRPRRPDVPGSPDALDEEGLRKLLRKDFRRDKQWKSDYEAALAQADEALRSQLVMDYGMAKAEREMRLRWLQAVRKNSVAPIAKRLGISEDDFWREMADRFNFDHEKLGLDRFRVAIADEVARLPEVVRSAASGANEVWDETIYRQSAAAKGRATMPETVTPEMAQHMRQWYREAAEKANANAVLGHTDWTPADLQAIDIARYQEVFNTGGFGYDPQDVMRGQTWAINYELEPALYTPNSRSFPSRATAADPEDFDDRMLLVQREFAKWLALSVSEDTGARVIATSVGPGFRRTAYRDVVEDVHAGEVFEDSDEWTSWGPQTNLVVQGSDEAVVAALLETGSLTQRQEMWATTVEHIEDVMGWRGRLPSASNQAYRERPLVEFGGQPHLPPQEAPIRPEGITTRTEMMARIVRELGNGDGERIDALSKYVGALDDMYRTGMGQGRGITEQGADTLRQMMNGVDSLTNEDVRRVYAIYQQSDPGAQQANFNVQASRILGRQQPGAASNIGISWVTDLKVAPGSDNLLGDLRDVADNLTEKWGTDNYMFITLPDGSKAIRFVHRDFDGWNNSLRDVDSIFELDDLPEGFEVKRGRVRSYSHSVDQRRVAERSGEIMSELNKQVEVTTGTRGPQASPNIVTNPAREGTPLGRLREKIEQAIREGSPISSVTDTAPENFGVSVDDAHALYRAIWSGRIDNGPEAIGQWRSGLDWLAHRSTDPWAAEAERLGHGHVVAALRDRRRGEANSRANVAYQRYLPEATDAHRAGTGIIHPAARGWHFQRTPGRGVRAAIHTTADLDSTLYFLKNADATSALHEVFHWFSGFFEDSLNKGLLDAYAAATGKRVRSAVAGKPVLTDTAEEWLAREFEKYATTGVVRNPALQAAFNTMGKLARGNKAASSLVEANPAVKEMFDKMMGQANATMGAVPFHPDEARFLSAARFMLSQSEEEAHRTHYFARGRNVIERSINHPYLGYYPASYMWGKVVPELVKFLIREPFGVNAPFWGYEMASHVAQAIQLQLHTDPEFQEWVEGHPELIRFALMMTPGSPWDIPVNQPAWARHVAREELRNTIREARGDETKQVDLFSEIADTTSYAFGPLRFAQTLGGVVSESTKFDQEQAAVEEPPKPRGGGVNLGSLMSGYGQDIADAQAELGPLLGNQ